MDTEDLADDKFARKEGYWDRTTVLKGWGRGTRNTGPELLRIAGWQLIEKQRGGLYHSSHEEGGRQSDGEFM